ncbi:dynactin subunit 1-like [Planoprotostelium fungivorum]|uniref:Dynactin subunit 1-like n=1 Tax=Planoprotostelium fungivorum TaxID=1890364 RepID=A0A2P6N4G1_9EUKA|nr:dynactin subunit 1-like [Planoprotostelium fungivorum]
MRTYLRKSHRELTDNNLISMCFDIVKGMIYLQSKGVIHRDLAARNMLIDSTKHVKKRLLFSKGDCLLFIVISSATPSVKHLTYDRLNHPNVVRLLGPQLIYRRGPSATSASPVTNASNIVDDTHHSNSLQLLVINERKTPHKPTKHPHPTGQEIWQNTTHDNMMHTEGQFVVGCRVKVKGMDDAGLGNIRFIGRTMFHSGVWAGVALDGPYGRIDGTVRGVKYFECKAQHGLMVRPNQMIIVDPDTMPAKSQPYHLLPSPTLLKSHLALKQKPLAPLRAWVSVAPSERSSQRVKMNMSPDNRRDVTHLPELYPAPTQSSIPTRTKNELWSTVLAKFPRAPATPRGSREVIMKKSSRENLLRNSKDRAKKSSKEMAKWSLRKNGSFRLPADHSITVENVEDVRQVPLTPPNTNQIRLARALQDSIEWRNQAEITMKDMSEKLKETSQQMAKLAKIIVGERKQHQIEKETIREDFRRVLQSEKEKMARFYQEKMAEMRREFDMERMKMSCDGATMSRVAQCSVQNEIEIPTPDICDSMRGLRVV